MSDRAPRRKGAPRDWRLTLEAAVWLTAAGVALRLLSFATLARLLSLSRPTDARPSHPEDAARVGRAVAAAAARAPWRPRCFERGLAACALLRVRGYCPALHYGAHNQGPTGLVAHVWVRLGEFDVVGCEEAEAFAVLATFP